MEPYVERLVDQLRGMWHRRFVGLAVAWIAAIVGVVVALLVPQRYEANARLQVDTLTILKPVLQGLSIEPNLDQQVALITRTLLNRGNMEKVASEFDPQRAQPTGAAREELIDRLARNVQIAGNASSNVYSITYRDTDPARAERVVSTLVQILLDTSAGGKREDSRSTLAFLDEQLARYEQSLQAAESKLKEFRLKYMGVPGQGAAPGQDYFARVSKLSDDIANARLELRSAAESRDAYRRQLAAQPAAGSALAVAAGDDTPAAPSEIDTRLAAQKAKLDDLLRTYTEQHPDVVGTRRVIADLEQQREREPRAAAKPAAGRPIEVSDRMLASQQIRVAYADAEAKVASAQARLAAYEAQYAQLAQSGKLIPQIDTELAQLTRDYDLQKKTYTDLLARREAAAMGASAQNSAGEQIRVIDPPRVSPRPVQPTRTALLFLAFLGALAAGVVASFLANRAFPTFQHAGTLASVSDRPVLGSLSLLPSEGAVSQRRRGFLLFASGFCALIASFMGVLTLAVMAGSAA